MARPLLLHPALRPLLHLLCALPLLGLVAGLFAQQLGANPAETLIRSLGDWALRDLLLTLAITPLRVLSAQPLWLRYRRLFGLWSFAYAVLHLLAYAAFDKGLDLGEVLRDVAKRPFILVGLLTFLLLLPLAATSFAAAQRALGGRRWQALHRAVYGALVLACLHFWWMRAAKNRLTEPALYALLAALLLAWRLLRARRAAAGGRAAVQASAQPRA